jgi:hypothetical protein
MSIAIIDNRIVLHTIKRILVALPTFQDARLLLNLSAPANVYEKSCTFETSQVDKS